MRIPDNTGLVQDPIHIGVVILDKIIGDIKSKLPFSKKKKGGEDDLDEEDLDEAGTETEVSAGDDEDEKTSVAKNLKSVKDGDDDDTSADEVPEDNSLVGKIKAKLSSLKKKESSGDDSEVLDDDGDTAKKSSKKKPNLIVIGGAVALIGFVILSDFGEETPTTDVATDTPALKPRKKPKQEKPAEDKPADTTAETNPDTTTADPTATTPDVTTAPDPTVTTTPDPTTTTPDVTTAPDPTVTTTPEPTTTTPDVTTPDPTVTTTPEPTTTEAPVTTDTPVMNPDNGTVDSVTGDDPSQSPDNLTEQILKDLENQATTTEKTAVRTDYVTPPNYENVGRGLVYNCSGRHWACVDAPSYKVCEDNSSSTKFLKKKAECYPFNVYDTQSGCEKMQNRMVSSSAKTEFCAE